MNRPKIDPLIHEPARLAIMATLHRHRRLRHATLGSHLGLTAGNVATHTRRLVDAGYLRAYRGITKGGVAQLFEITERGDAAFEAYVRALLDYLGAATEDPS